MKSPRFICFSVPALICAAFPAMAANVYWDVNGITTGGAAGTTADGTWSSSSTNWGNASGNVTTAAWVANDAAFFSAGTGVTGASAITVSGTQTVGNMTFDEGAVTFTGGTLAFGTSARTFTVASGAAATFNTDLSASVTLIVKGTLSLNGATTSTATGSAFDIGSAGANGRVNLGSSGSLGIAAGALRVGVNGSAATTNSGSFYQADSSSVTVSAVTLGTASGAGTVNSGYYSLANSATLGAASMTLGAAGTLANSNVTTAIFDQSGGSATVSDFVRLGSTNASTGMMNLTGGTFTFNGTGVTNDTSYVVGYANGRGELNVRGTGLLNLGTTSLRIGGNATATGVVNLGTGGIIAAARVIDAGGASTFNFNGGTLKAAAATTGTNYLVAVDAAYVYAGGARIDSNGFNVTIAQALQAPAGDGVQSVAVSGGGSGYNGAPLVSITGGGGSGATGYAVMNAAGTQVVSIVITNPGTGYTSAPTVTLIGGGGSGATLGTASLVANAGGALTKIGLGTLTLAAVNTYQGGTRVEKGVVAFTASNTLSGANAFTIDSAGTAGVNYGQMTVSGGGVTLTQGGTLTINFSGTLSGDATFNLFATAAGGVLAGNYGTASGNVSIAGSYVAALANSGSLWTGSAGGYDFSFDQGTGILGVTASAIPEPSTWALFAGVTVLAGAARRFRRAV